MPWFKVDDSLAFSAKFIALPLDAAGLWVRCGAWSAQQLSDGYVPVEVVKSMGGTTKQTGSLIRQGLWENAPGGFQFHDWLDYQPSGESVRAERAEAARRMREVRSKRKGTHRPEPDSSDEVPPNVQANGDRTCDETSDEVREPFGYPDPVPVPVPVPLPVPTPFKDGGEAARSVVVVPDSETLNQRANRLTKAYTDIVTMSNFAAIAGIVRKACSAGHGDDTIQGALLRLAHEGRPVTVDVLRIEIEGLPALSGGSARKREGDRILQEAMRNALDAERNAS